jgi:hypothetical protein
MNSEQIKRLTIVVAIGVSIICGVIAAYSAYGMYEAESQINSLNLSSRQINETCPEAQMNPTVRGPFIACMQHRFPSDVNRAGHRYGAAQSRLEIIGIVWAALLLGIGFLYVAYKYVRRGGET